MQRQRSVTPAIPRPTHRVEVNPLAIPETGFLRLPEVLRFFPVSRSTWWAGVRARRYPQPIKLGARVSAWRAEDIRALIASRTSGEVQP